MKLFVLEDFIFGAVDTFDAFTLLLRCWIQACLVINILAGLNFSGWLQIIIIGIFLYMCAELYRELYWQIAGKLRNIIVFVGRD